MLFCTVEYARALKKNVFRLLEISTLMESLGISIILESPYPFEFYCHLKQRLVIHKLRAGHLDTQFE